MTKINFYILGQTEEADRLHFTCRLVTKARQLGHRILLQAEHQQQAEILSQLLWEVQPDSFLPHALPGETATENTPISLNIGDDPGSQHHDLLINLSSQIPAFFSRFERVSEVACQLAPQLTASREHWKFYQDRGYPLELHKL